MNISYHVTIFCYRKLFRISVSNQIFLMLAVLLYYTPNRVMSCGAWFPLLSTCAKEMSQRWQVICDTVSDLTSWKIILKTSCNDSDVVDHYVNWPIFMEDILIFFTFNKQAMAERLYMFCFCIILDP